jgi:hypothetical protein
VSATDILPLLTGPAAALVICVWVIWWLRADLKELRKTNRELARRADSSEEAARTSNALLEKAINLGLDRREMHGGDP